MYLHLYEIFREQEAIEFGWELWGTKELEGAEKNKMKRKTNIIELHLFQ